MIMKKTIVLVTIYDGNVDDNDNEDDSFGHKDDGHNV